MSKPTFQDKPFWYLGTGAYWFVTSLKWFVLFLLQPLQVAELVPGGEKNGTWGMIVAIGAFEAMIGPALMGWLSDRTRTRFGRRRPFLAIGAALTSVALLLLGQANSLVFMAIAYLFLQVSDDVATGPYAALIYDQVPEDHRGKASGILSMLQLVAQIAAVGIGVGLGKIALIYFAVAVINIVCAVTTLAIWHEPAVVERHQNEALPALPKLSLKSWTEPFRSPDFRWVWLARFLVAFGFYLILLYVSNYLKDRVHSLTLFGLDLKEPQNGALIGSGIAAKLVDTVGRKKTIGICGWVMAAALVPFALIPNFTLIFCVALVFGLAYGVYLSASYALAADVLPNPDDAAKDMGIWQASVSTPQVLTGLVGLLVDAGNRLGSGQGYTVAFLLSSAAFLTGCLLVQKVQASR
jgi:MFS family permease